MQASNSSDVSKAFELLLDQFEIEIGSYGRLGAQAFQARNYDKVEAIRKQSELIVGIRDEVVTLRDKWKALIKKQNENNTVQHINRWNKRRVSKRRRTPEENYYIPILLALTVLGGSAKKSKVLDKVYGYMKNWLNDVDHEPLPSHPNILRWDNTAQWARSSLRKDGYIKSDSPHGIWEISAAGRKKLKEWESK